MSETLDTPGAPQDQLNPLLRPWQTPFETPPFAQIKPEHFLPAFEQAFADHAAEVAAIEHDPSAPDFANTITALERSGKLLSKVSAVFYDLVSAHSNPELLEIDKEVSLRMARHWNPIMMNAVLFGRIALLHDNRAALSLTPEQMRLLERTYTRFRRSGAGLDEAAKKRMAEINERLAHLGTAFSHHLLADEQDWFMELGEADRDGLPDSFVAAAKAAAEDRGMPGKAIVTLSRSSVEPFLKSSGRRDLREKVFRAFTARGDNNNANDNNETIVEILSLREETAKLLGFPTFAAYRLEDSMAKTPQAVRGLLERVWQPARARALRDRDDLQALVTEEGGNFTLAPWDWRYYAEKLRQRRANFDDAAIKPYLSLDHMIEAAFDCASRLFGLSFEARTDVPVWHPDVRVWEVKDSAGKHKALFYGDYFARPSKRSGAWMTSLRDQQKLDGEVAPLILNVCNFNKGAEGEPSLLSPDDARTLFHEFGHGLHGMLSDVFYPSLSGTSVFTDFVELPSQLYEHWQEQPQVLQQFARHYQSAGRPVAAFPRRAQIQPGLCHRRIRVLGADRSGIPHPAGRGDPGRAGVRTPGTRKDRHARGNLAAAPAAAVRPHLLRRSLRGRLLQLHVVRGDGRRRVRRFRGSRQHLRSRGRQAPARRHLFLGRLARSRRRLCRIPRPGAGARRPAAPPRSSGNARGGLK
jgi:peptidyl-dipeptidase Dcp